MNKQQQKLILKSSVKRIGITTLCCLPCLLLIGYCLQGLNSAATVAIFVLFMLAAICIEEYIHLKIANKKQVRRKLLHKDEDVFK